MKIKKPRIHFLSDVLPAVAVLTKSLLNRRGKAMKALELYKEYKHTNVTDFERFIQKI